MLVDGVRRWVPFDMQGLENDDFPALGAAFEAAHGIVPGLVGKAEVRLLRQRSLVDFAVEWLDAHRA